MRWLAGIALAVVGCGDNRKAADDAADAPLAPPRCQPIRGTHVSVRQVASACYVTGAPEYPDCVIGTASLVTAPAGDRRLWVLEQLGRVRILDHDGFVPEPVLDIAHTAMPPLVSVSELGLLGLAFHPEFATNRTFFIYYTALGDAESRYYNVVTRYTTYADKPDVADPASATVVLSIPDFAGNHNGGMIEFGPDGYLYIGTGDGGNQADPMRVGQNPHALLGKILRIDVDNQEAGMQYAIPADNPFADGVGGAREVFILGVRNPWRFSFDALTGDLWIGDVGQNEIEEINVLRPGEQSGANLGWSMYEGNTCFHAPCSPSGLTFPVDGRTHVSGWCAVIGGQVYRGGCYPDLRGWYFYTDYCKHGLSRARLRADGSLEIFDLPGEFPAVPASIHADASGELYLTDEGGNIYRIEAGP